MSIVEIDLDEIEKLLSQQSEVKYLTYMVHVTYDNVLHIELSTMGYTKKFKYKQPNLFLVHLVDILKDMKTKEKYLIKKEEQRKLR